MNNTTSHVICITNSCSSVLWRGAREDDSVLSDEGRRERVVCVREDQGQGGAPRRCAPEAAGDNFQGFQGRALPHSGSYGRCLPRAGHPEGRPDYSVRAPKGRRDVHPQEREDGESGEEGSGDHVLHEEAIRAGAEDSAPCRDNDEEHRGSTA